MILLKTLLLWLVVGLAFFGWRRGSDRKGFEAGSTLSPRNDRHA
jgi:hypothetical protein